jgi:hypothetical protein
MGCGVSRARPTANRYPLGRVAAYMLDLSFSVRDLLLTIPAWTGATVAVLGLGAWRRQLHGKERYDLARRLLRATYRYRDALQEARSSITFALPQPDIPQLALQSRRDQAAAIWQSRFDPLNAARRELEAELLESEVLWGSDHRAHYMALLDVDSQLYAAVLEQLDSLEPEPDESIVAPERVTVRRATMYARSDRSDALSQSTIAAVTAVEAVLRPYLRR